MKLLNSEAGQSMPRPRRESEAARTRREIHIIEGKTTAFRELSSAFRSEDILWMREALKGYETYLLTLPENKEDSGTALDIAKLRTLVTSEIIGFRLLLNTNEFLAGVDSRLKQRMTDSPSVI
ncbi:MAG: hypothetical protein ACR2PT_06840 [Endozoicomonas sp.]